MKQIGKKLGIIKPRMFMICDCSSSQQFHILVATTYINGVKKSMAEPYRDGRVAEK
jgi:hypothetical protein